MIPAVRTKPQTKIVAAAFAIAFGALTEKEADMVQEAIERRRKRNKKA